MNGIVEIDLYNTSGPPSEYFLARQQASPLTQNIHVGKYVFFSSVHSLNPQFSISDKLTYSFPVNNITAISVTLTATISSPPPPFFIVTSLHYKKMLQLRKIFPFCVCERKRFSL